MRAQLGLELGRVVVAASNREPDLPEAQATLPQRLRHASCQTCLVHAIHLRLRSTPSGAQSPIAHVYLTPNRCSFRLPSGPPPRPKGPN